MVKRVHHLCEMYKENKTALSKILFTIPATWEGLQAVKTLEAEGIECHAVHCYRLPPLFFPSLGQDDGYACLGRGDGRGACLLGADGTAC